MRRGQSKRGSPTCSGVTSVWVGSQPTSDRVQSSNSSFDSGTSDDDRHYFVVSVRNSGSDSESNLQNSNTTMSSPASSTSNIYSSPGLGQTNSGNNSISPFSTLSPPLGSMQFQANPYYLQNSSLAGSTSSIPGNANNSFGNTSALYSGGSFYPTGVPLPMTMLPQGSLDPASMLLQQQLNSDFLAASLDETLSFAQSQPLQSQPQAQVPMPYLAPSYNILPVAGGPNQLLMYQAMQQPEFNVLSSNLSSPQMLPFVTNPGMPSSLSGMSPAGTTSNSPQSVKRMNNNVFKAPVEKNDSVSDDGSSVGVGGQKLRLRNSSSLDTGDEQTTSGLGSSAPSSPSDSSPTSPHSDLHALTYGDQDQLQTFKVDPCYDRPRDKQACMRCGKKVYAMEKIGPVKDVLYHKTCFTCGFCYTQLNLKNFHHNEEDLADLNVYCLSHKPIARANPLDSTAVGIQRALTVPKQQRINEQIRGGADASKNTHLDSNSVSIRAAMHVPAPDLQASIKQREGSWFREERKYEHMPPQDVVKYDENSCAYEGSRSLYMDPR